MRTSCLQPSGRLLATLCIVALCAGCGGRRSEQFRVEGDTFLHLNKLDDAAASYHKSEKADPKNAMPKLGLARVLVLQGDFDGALEQFKAAIALQPALEDAYIEGARTALSQNLTEEAEALAKQLTAVKPERGGILQAYVLRRTQRAGEAIDLLTELAEKFAASADVRITLAGAYLADNAPDKAEQALQFVLQEIAPNSLEARMALIEVYRAQGKVGEIVAQLELLAKENPDDANINLSLARSLLYSSRFDEAEKIAKELLEDAPELAWANYVMGHALLSRGEKAQAIAYLRKAADALPEEAAVAQTLALARGASSRTPSQPSAPARAAMGGDWRTLWQKAAMLSLLRKQEAFAAEEGGAAGDTLALAAVFTHNMALANDIAARLPEASHIPGYLKVLESDSLQQVVDYFSAWEEEEGSERHLLRENALGYALARKGNRGRALQVYSGCLQQWPESAVGLFNIAQVFRGTRTPQFAARTLQRLIAIYPGNIDAHSLLFITLREAGLNLEARQAAETSYALFPETVETVLNLSQAYLDNGEPARALMVIERGLENAPQEAGFQLARANTLLKQGRPAEAQAALDAMEARKNLAGPMQTVDVFCAALLGEWPRVLALGEALPVSAVPLHTRFLMSSAYVATGRPGEARGLFEQPADGARPGAVLGGIVWTALGGAAAAELNEGDKALAEALAGAPEALADLTLAAACQLANLDDAALAAFDKVHLRVGGNPRTAQLMLVSLAKAKNVKEPIARARALAGGVANAEVWLSMAAVARTLEDEEEESAALDKALQTAPANASVLMQRALFFERTDQIEKALMAYTQCAKLAPENAALNNNLAYLILTTGGDEEEALERARKANEKIPANSSILHTLGLAQLRTGDLEASAKSLSQALELRPGDPTLLLDFGKLLIEQDKSAEGLLHIQLALRYAGQLKLNFPRRAEAEDLLENAG